MFGISFLTTKIKHAVARYQFERSAPPIAGPDEVDAQLDVLFCELLLLTAPGRDLSDFDASVARACARIEEWTA